MRKSSVLNLSSPTKSSDTIDTGEEDAQHFMKSDRIVPHAFVHLPDQVRMGGTHQFHNTSAVESHHKPCIQLAGTRVRKYNDVNITERNMLTYTLQMHLFDEIAVMIDKGRVRVRVRVIEAVA